MDPASAGEKFVAALRRYLMTRRQSLVQSKAIAHRHEQRYRDLLEALGYEEDSKDFKALVKHMEQMKTAGGVRK